MEAGTRHRLNLLGLALLLVSTVSAPAQASHRRRAEIPAGTPQTSSCFALVRLTTKSLPALPDPQHVSLDSTPPPLPFVRDSVIAAIMNDRGDVLMNQRGGAVGYGQWGVLGGKLDPGETLRQGLLRELGEEVGVHELGPAKLIYVHYHYDAAHNQYYRVFVVRAELTPNTIPSIREPEKILQLEWFSLDELPSPLFSEFGAYKAALR